MVMYALVSIASHKIPLPDEPGHTSYQHQRQAVRLNSLKVFGGGIHSQFDGGATTIMTLPHLPNPLPVFLRLVLLFRRWNRPLLLLVAVSLSLDILLTIQTSRVGPSLSYNTHSSGEKIFIAGLHWNDEALIRSHWAPAVLALVQHLGVENVYVSTIEGGSWDNTTAALWEFDAELQKLGVKRSIASLPLLTHEAVVNRLPEPGEQGWIDTPRGKRELRRIPYLASLRNHAMLPLEKLAGQMRFDRVLWLNDVIFTVSR